MDKKEALFNYLLRKADDSLILGHRNSEWCGHGPVLEEDIALTNISLDLVGQATELYKYATKVEDKGRNEDDLAFLRIEREYKNVLLVEQPNGDYAQTITREFLFDHFEVLLYERLQNSKDDQVAAIAEKTLKEIRYHLKHTSEWMIRFGDGTEESHDRAQNAVDNLSRFINEIFYQDEVDTVLIKEGVIPDISTFKEDYFKNIRKVLDEATLNLPDIKWPMEGGRKGVHSESMGYLLAELQYMQRAYPGMEW